MMSSWYGILKMMGSHQILVTEIDEPAKTSRIVASAQMRVWWEMGLA